MAVLSVLVSPDAVGTVIEVTAGVVIRPSHAASSAVTVVSSGIATITLLALLAINVICGSVPVPAVISVLILSIGFVVQL